MTTNIHTYSPKNNFQTPIIKERREQLLSFIHKRLLTEKGITTNYLDGPKQKEFATGHELLSESASLYLTHLAFSKNQQAYDDFYKKTIHTFYDKGQFSYRVSEKGKKYAINASIDDLRIIRSLIQAQVAFNDDNYGKTASKLGKTFIKNSTNDYIIVDFYDTSMKQKSSVTSLFYVDLLTLGLLYQKLNIPATYLQQQYELVKDGYISDTFPFYKANYDHKAKQYSQTNINIIESLLTIFHLSEVGLQKQTSIDFVKQQVHKGTLFNSYDEDGIPVDKSQSAASYALAALIGSTVGDKELYDQAILVLNNFQVSDKGSHLYGGFGDQRTNKVYSYDNLMALLAYDV